MATPEQRDAYRTVIGLIMEEVEGCHLDPKARETVELMNVVEELKKRIIEGPDLRKPFTPAGPSKPHPFKQKYQPQSQSKKPKAWQRGPLANVPAKPVPKPAWFTDEEPSGTTEPLPLTNRERKKLARESRESRPAPKVHDGISRVRDCQTGLQFVGEAGPDILVDAHSDRTAPPWL